MQYYQATIFLLSKGLRVQLEFPSCRNSTAIGQNDQRTQAESQQVGKSTENQRVRKTHILKTKGCFASHILAPKRVNNAEAKTFLAVVHLLHCTNNIYSNGFQTFRFLSKHDINHAGVAVCFRLSRRKLTNGQTA